MNHQQMLVFLFEEARMEEDPEERKVRMTFYQNLIKPKDNKIAVKIKRSKPRIS